VVVEHKGVPLIFNEGAERILGSKAEEMIGNPEDLSAVSIPPDWRRDDAADAQRLNTGRRTS